MTDTGWRHEVAALWACFDECTKDEFLAAMQRLVAQRPAADPVALYEHGSAYDSIGREEPAVAKYAGRRPEACPASCAGGRPSSWPAVCATLPSTRKPSTC